MKASLQMTICIFLFFGVGQSSHAANIKCWQNKQKIRECGENVPPEYAQQRIEILNDQGIVVKIIEPRKSKAQLAKEAHLAKIQEAKDERRRQDMILLKTFAKEQDLLLSRDKQLSAIDSTITIANGNLKILNSSLVQLQKQAANHERSGTAVPKHLVGDIESVKSQIVENEKYLADKKLRRREIEDKFASDLKRYRKLKKVRPR